MGRSNISVKVDGGEGLIRKLEAMGKNVSDELEPAALAGAGVIQIAANMRAPGPHVEMDVAERGDRRVSVDIGPDEAHWYYRFFETGAGPHEITGSPLVFPGREGTVVTGRVMHPGMAASPFLRPAMDEQKDNAVETYGKQIRKRTGF